MEQKNQLIDILEKSLKRQSDSLVHLKSYEELSETVDFNLGSATTEEDWKKFLDQYLQFSVNTAHAQFHNQLWSGFSFDSLAAEIMTNSTNTSMYTYEVAPMATIVEKTIIQKVLNLIGFNNGDGIFTTGGTASNISALLAARNAYDGKVANEGLAGRKFKAFTSSSSHYSYKKAMNITGLGIDNLVLVESDSNGRMLVEDLKKKILGVKENGDIPLFIGATSGTTVYGSFDPIKEIGEIARSENIWLHVDGAFGGSFIFHDEFKEKYFQGLELANSFSFDAHKALGISLICAMFFVQSPQNIYKAHDHGSGDDYIFRSENSFDLGPMSIQCGRKVDALKFFLYWKRVGNEGIKKRLEKMLRLASYAERKVKESDQLYMTCERESLSVCFRYRLNQRVEKDAISEAEFNVEIRDELHRQELALVNYGQVNGEKSIRLVLTNPEVKESDLDLLFENFLKVARELEKKYV